MTSKYVKQPRRKFIKRVHELVTELSTDVIPYLKQCQHVGMVETAEVLEQLVDEVVEMLPE